MAHVEPSTWVDSRIGGTGQFLEPLCPVAWVGSVTQTRFSRQFILANARNNASIFVIFHRV
eukprot:1385819-Pyramimonas_sp.AAC.1